MKYFFYLGPDLTYYCDNHTCKGGMQIEEGEECYKTYYLGELDSFNIPSTLQCKEGLVCVRNSTYSSYEETYTCKKPKNRKGKLNYCYDDSDCGYDSTCECDDNIGLTVCVPKPVSTKKLRDLYLRFAANESISDVINFYEYLIEDHLYFSSYFRCGGYKKSMSAASSLRASAVMTIFTALVALLLSF